MSLLEEDPQVLMTAFTFSHGGATAVDSVPYARPEAAVGERAAAMPPSSGFEVEPRNVGVLFRVSSATCVQVLPRIVPLALSVPETQVDTACSFWKMLPVTYVLLPLSVFPRKLFG